MVHRKKPAQDAKRRTTVTLPADTLAHAKRVARDRRVNLSTVIAEALAEGLRGRQSAERSQEVLKAYRRAFEGFSEQEMLLLDGVILQPSRRRK